MFSARTFGNGLGFVLPLVILALGSCQRVFDNPWDPLNIPGNSGTELGGDTSGGGGGGPTTYTLVYDAPDKDGGDPPTDSTAYSLNQNATVSGNPGGLYRNGYTLVGWKVGSLLFLPGDTFPVTTNTTLLAEWAPSNEVLYGLTPNPAPNASEINDLAATEDGSVVYATGYLSKNSSFTWGGVSVNGADSFGENFFLLKINGANNTVEWARSVITAPNSSFGKAIAVDQDGNSYCALTIFGTTNYTLETGKTVKGVSSSFSTAALVKYDSSGAVVWTSAPQSGNGKTEWKGLAYRNGRVFAVGLQQGSSTITWKSGLTTTVTTSNVRNPLVACFDAATGEPLWAKVVSGPSHGQFNRVRAHPTLPRLVAAGSVMTSNSFTYDSVNIQGGHTGENALVLVFDEDGSYIWHYSTSSGTTASSQGTGVAFFGQNSLVLTGSYYKSTLAQQLKFDNLMVSNGASGSDHLFVAHLDIGDGPTRLQTWRNSSSGSEGRDLQVDIWGNVYIAGFLRGGNYVMGPSDAESVSVTGPTNNENLVLIKLLPTGRPEWIRTHQFTSSSGSEWYSLALASNRVWVGGFVRLGNHGLGDSKFLNGVYGSGPNGALAAYRR